MYEKYMHGELSMTPETVEPNRVETLRKPPRIEVKVVEPTEQSPAKRENSWWGVGGGKFLVIYAGSFTGSTGARTTRRTDFSSFN